MEFRGIFLLGVLERGLLMPGGRSGPARLLRRQETVMEASPWLLHPAAAI
jgi:hypothetical protein